MGAGDALSFNDLTTFTNNNNSISHAGGDSGYFETQGDMQGNDVAAVFARFKAKLKDVSTRWLQSKRLTPITKMETPKVTTNEPLTGYCQLRSIFCIYVCDGIECSIIIFLHWYVIYFVLLVFSFACLLATWSNSKGHISSNESMELGLSQYRESTACRHHSRWRTQAHAIRRRAPSAVSQGAHS